MRVPVFRSAHAHRKESMVRQNEKRVAISPAKDKLQRALGDIDLRDLLAVRRVDEDLPVSDIDIAMGIDGYAFAAALDKGLQIGEGAVGVHFRVVGDVFRLAADVDTLAGFGS